MFLIWRLAAWSARRLGRMRAEVRKREWTRLDLVRYRIYRAIYNGFCGTRVHPPPLDEDAERRVNQKAR